MISIFLSIYLLFICLVFLIYSLSLYILYLTLYPNIYSNLTLSLFFSFSFLIRIVTPSMRPNNNGNHFAITSYQTLRTFTYKSQIISLLELIPHTGQKRQLRSHCCYQLSCPIIGETKFPNKKLLADIESELYLHAHQIVFKIDNFRARRLTAPLPKHFVMLLQELETTL
jgi:hypothetical protein